MTRILLSNNQYSMLKLFAAQREGDGFSEEEVGGLVQTTFGSMLKHKWVKWTGTHFVISAVGITALRDFDQADLMRKVASLNLTRYWVRPRRRPAVTEITTEGMRRAS